MNVIYSIDIQVKIFRHHYAIIKYFGDPVGRRVVDRRFSYCLGLVTSPMIVWG